MCGFEFRVFTHLSTRIKGAKAFQQKHFSPSCITTLLWKKIKVYLENSSDSHLNYNCTSNFWVYTISLDPTSTMNKEPPGDETFAFLYNMYF